jgi:Calcineurin-like phosphoesterase
MRIKDSFKRSNEEYLKMYLIFAPVYLLIVVMVILSISIQGGIAIVENHSVYGSSPPPSPTATLSDFNFAAAGDWGCTSHTTDTVKNILDKNPELVLGLGDYSYHQDRVDCWFEIIQPIDGITKIVLGNHDTGEEIEELMNHFDLTEQFYSFDYQNVHFIALATEEEYLDMSNDKAKEQLAFVKSDLEKASTNPNIDWIIPFFHRMMYARESAGVVDTYDHNLEDIYHPLFEQLG